MILKKEQKDALFAELTNSFPELLAEANIRLSRGAQTKLLAYFKFEITFEYFRDYSLTQFFIIGLVAPQWLARFLLSGPSEESFSIFEHLTEQQSTALRLSVQTILEKYRDFEAEARIQAKSRERVGQQPASSAQSVPVTRPVLTLKYDSRAQSSDMYQYTLHNRRTNDPEQKIVETFQRIDDLQRRLNSPCKKCVLM